MAGPLLLTLQAVTPWSSVPSFLLRFVAHGGSAISIGYNGQLFCFYTIG